MERLEHVTVTMNVNHTRRGDLSVDLKSPTGIVSRISVSRVNDAYVGGYEDWTFMSVAHWGESGVGTWTVIVKDANVNGQKGEFSASEMQHIGTLRSMDSARTHAYLTLLTLHGN